MTIIDNQIHFILHHAHFFNANAIIIFRLLQYLVDSLGACQFYDCNFLTNVLVVYINLGDIHYSIIDSILCKKL